MTAPAGMRTLDAAAIDCGHREMLETLDELLSGLERSDAELDAESLRATIAFLRQGVVPFARREERGMEATCEVRECVAFEHAFLEAEIDRLAREASVLLEAGSSADGQPRRSAGAVWRSLCRIQAVLELHTHRADERDGCPPAGDAATRFVAAGVANRAAAGDGSTSRETMRPAEAERFLRAHGWGVLSTMGRGRPYAVPVSYGFDGGSVFIATGAGRKADNIAESGAVCLTVVEVVDGRRWRCVVVSGDATWIEGRRERLSAVRLLAGSAMRHGSLDLSKLKRLAGSRLVRIEPVEISGRRRGG